MAFGIRAEDGTVGAPIYSFANDTDTGLYRIGANNVGLAANGAKVAEWGTGGITLASGKTLVFGDATIQTSAPGIVRISESVVSGAAATSISFSSISSSYRSLRIVIYGRSTVAGGTSNVSFRLNGDSGANYDWQEIRATNTTVSATPGNGDTSARIGLVPGNTATANVFGALDILIPNHANTSNQKSLAAKCGSKSGTAAADMIMGEFSAYWRSNSAITSIELFTQNQWSIGTVASLYGIL